MGTIVTFMLYHFYLQIKQINQKVLIAELQKVQLDGFCYFWTELG